MRTNTALLPGTHSSRLNRKGPEPITSVSGVVVGSFASRSGITTGGKPEALAMPSSTRPNGSFSVRVKVLASTAFHSAAEIAVMARPMLSFEVQRCIEATTSAEVTARAVGELEVRAAG